MQSYAVFKGKKRLRSPVSRIGGKSFLVSWLKGFILYHRFYIEVFGGGASLLFAKEPSPIEVYNDLDGGLINFFRILRDPEKIKRLQELLNLTPYSRQEFYDCRLTWQDQQDDVERAYRWFVTNRMSFAGDMLRGGFATPGVSTNRNPAQSFRTAIDGIEAVSRRLRNVTIENLNYKECIQRYDSPDSLFYIDPPYLDTEHYYGKASFTHNDHYRLAELLHEVKGKVMITHVQNELYDDLYKGWNRFEYESFKGSHKVEANTEKPKTIEVLYCNFEPTQKQNELFKNI